MRVKILEEFQEIFLATQLENCSSLKILFLAHLFHTDMEGDLSVRRNKEPREMKRKQVGNRWNYITIMYWLCFSEAGGVAKLTRLLYEERKLLKKKQ
jgi:hypothetical protein